MGLLGFVARRELAVLARDMLGLGILAGEYESGSGQHVMTADARAFLHEGPASASTRRFAQKVAFDGKQGEAVK